MLTGQYYSRGAACRLLFAATNHIEKLSYALGIQTLHLGRIEERGSLVG